MLEYSVQETLSLLISVILCVSVHEFNHAFVLYCFGYSGVRHRLTLNPFVHFPVYSTGLLLFTGFVFGRPVIFDIEWLEEKKNKYLILILTKVMGPVSNLISAVVGVMLMKYVYLCPYANEAVHHFFAENLYWIVYFNIYFFFFNMLPISPLDGGIFLQVLSLRIFGSSFVLDIIGIVFVLVILVCSIFGLNIPLLDEFLMQAPEALVDWLIQSFGIYRW
ncbi:MAG: hypothetical protein GX115_05685 [Ruminiclostridium sp.]|nr:hypothetical protein [Ruminiclostridium sp.]